MAKLSKLFKSRLFRGTARGLTVRGVLGSLGGAALAGVGWKIGADVYDAVKNRVRKTAEGEESDLEPEIEEL
jgi:hypothetical protein